MVNVITQLYQENQGTWWPDFINIHRDFPYPCMNTKEYKSFMQYAKTNIETHNLTRMELHFKILIRAFLKCLLLIIYLT